MNNLSKSVLFILVSIFQISCSDEEPANRPDPVEEKVNVKIAVDIKDDYIATGEEIVFTVKKDSGEDITSKSKIYINDKEISSSKFIFSKADNYKVRAEYKENKSINELDLTVIDKKNFFKQNEVLEYFTGTWDPSHHLRSIILDTNYKILNGLISVEFHVNSPKGDFDIMQNEFSNKLNELFDAPCLLYSRSMSFDPLKKRGNRLFKKGVSHDKSLIGIKLKSKLDSEILLDVEFKLYKEEDFNNLKLVVFLLEDGLKADQKVLLMDNSATAVIKDYEYNNVLRHSFTDVLGDKIDPKQIKNNIYKKKFKANIPSNVTNKSNLGFVVMVCNAKTNSVLNARYVKANQSSEYAYYY